AAIQTRARQFRPPGLTRLVDARLAPPTSKTVKRSPKRFRGLWVPCRRLRPARHADPITSVMWIRSESWPVELRCADSFFGFICPRLSGESKPPFLCKPPGHDPK